MQHILIADAIYCPKCQSALGLHENLTYCYECKVHFLSQLQRNDHPDAKNALQLVFEMRDGTPAGFRGTTPPETFRRVPHDPDTIPADPVGECDYSDLLPTPENPRQTPTPGLTQHRPQNHSNAADTATTRQPSVAPQKKQTRSAAVSILTGTPRPKTTPDPSKITQTHPQRKKSKPPEIKHRIVAYLRQNNAPAKTGEMLQVFGCSTSTLKAALDKLTSTGKVIKLRQGVWALPNANFHHADF